MTKWKQLCFILSTKVLKLQTYLNCHFPISCIHTFHSKPPKNFDYYFYGTCVSPQMSNRVFSCKHIIYPEWKCILVDFLQRSLVPRFGPKKFLKRWNLSCFVHFQKQYPNDLLSCQKFCWFSFDMLSIICSILLSTFLAFIYFTSQLHICYLTSCSFHPILYIGSINRKHPYKQGC